MYWETELLLIVRSLINDLADPPTYSDDRILQLITIAAQYVTIEATLNTNYAVDIINGTITPDPCDPNSRDVIFSGLTAMKAACLLDYSTYRTKAAGEGLRAALGPASLTVNNRLGGYKDLINMGPCKLYEQLLLDNNIGNAAAVRAVLSPFVSNDFDPINLPRTAPGSKGDNL